MRMSQRCDITTSLKGGYFILLYSYHQYHQPVMSPTLHKKSAPALFPLTKLEVDPLRKIKNRELVFSLHDCEMRNCELENYSLLILYKIPEKLLRNRNHDSIGIGIDPPLHQTILCDYPLVHSLADYVAALYRHLQKHLVASEVPDHPRISLLLSLVRSLVQ